MTTKCFIENCEKVSYVKGLCTTHYKRQWRHGNPTTTLLKMERTKCVVDDCSRLDHSQGYCKLHHLRLTRYGRLDNVKAKSGKGSLTANGYRVLTVNGKRIYEHVYLAEKALGKPLPRKAVVHHMNEKPADNFTPFNLVICPNQAYHLLLHKRARDLTKCKAESIPFSKRS